MSAMLPALALAVTLALVGPAPAAAAADPLEARAERLWADYSAAWSAADRVLGDARTPPSMSAALIEAEASATPAVLAMTRALAELLAARRAGDAATESAARAVLAELLPVAAFEVRRLKDRLTPSAVA